MEDRKELNEILLGERKKSSSGKKAVFVVLVAVIVIVVIAFVMWKVLSPKEELPTTPNVGIDSTTMKPLDSSNGDNIFGNGFVDFDSLNTDTNPANTSNHTQSEPNDTKPFDMNFGSENDTKESNLESALPSNIESSTHQASKKETDIDAAMKNIPALIEEAPKPKQTTSPAKPTTYPKPQTDSQSIQAPKQTQTPQTQKPKEPIATPTKPSHTSTTQTSNTNNTNASANNGLAPTKGFYWQIGSFEKDPNNEFLTLIKKYPYRIHHTKKDNTPTTRYLLGPYKTKNEAPNKQEIADLFKENPTPVEIP